MKTCLFTEYAEADLFSISEHVAKNNPARAFSFTQELRARCNEIAFFSEAAPLRPEIGRGIRSINYQRYLILYSIKKDIIVIEGVVHGARDINNPLQ